MIERWIAQNIVRIAIGVGLLLAAWWLVATLMGGKRAKVEAGLNKNVAESALESGKDAVGALGRQQAAEASSDRLSAQNEKDIRNAKGANASVDPAVRDAGLRSLCKRAASNLDPKCVQHTPPR